MDPNRTLAIHFQKDYLISGIKPFVGDPMKVLSSKGNPGSYLYFLVDPVSNRIDYGPSYKSAYENREPNVFGDFLNEIVNADSTFRRGINEVPLVELLLEIVNDIRSTYFSKMEDHLPNVNRKDPIPTYLSFADDISEKSVLVMKDYLRNNGFEIRYDRSVPAELLTASFLLKAVSVDRARCVVLEAYGNDLSMSLIDVLSRREIERTRHAKFEGLGVDPRISVIARYMVDQINSTTNRLTTDKDKLLEYERHYSKAESMLAELEKTTRPFISETTTFAIEPAVERKVILKKSEIEQSTMYHIKNVSRSFINFVQNGGQKTEDIQIIFLMGKAFSNDKLVEEFNRFGKEKVQVIPEGEEYRILEGLLLRSELRSDPSSSGSLTGWELPNAQTPILSQPQSPSETILVASLVIGRCLRLVTNNNDGKGEAIEEFKYLGNSTFLVLSSSRGQVRSNDFAKTLSPVWVSGLQIQFEITRNGLRFPNPLTIYSTRKVIRIESK